jgi:ABC-2 type transport system permease protein
MNKIWLIIKREFLTRVRKKSFLITTLLIPLLFAGMIALVGVLISAGDDETVVILDESEFFEGKLADADGVKYQFSNEPFDSLKSNYLAKGFSGFLHIPVMDIQRPANIVYYSKGQMNVVFKSSMERRLSSIIENKRMEAAGIDSEKLNSIRYRVNIINRAGEEEKEGSAGIAYAIGYGSGFLVYMILLIFGSMVMAGVMEEKTTRIAEVMISSVRPFQLMMGKIIGIGAVGLTQFLIWGVLFFLINLFMQGMIDPEITQKMAAGQQVNGMEMNEFAYKFVSTMSSVNWWLIGGLFLFYFLGGYLFYASLFAAVGSLVNEDPRDAQALTFPITLPVILSIFIMMAAVRNPNGELAFWGSIIPFSSPVVMMARIPYGVPGTVPYWQLGLSMALLIAGFMGTTWMAGKIYRTGILMYGKKITLKEVGRWLVRKN